MTIKNHSFVNNMKMFKELFEENPWAAIVVLFLLICIMGMVDNPENYNLSNFR